MYQSDTFNKAVIYEVPFEGLQKVRNMVYHTNTCDLLKSKSLIDDVQLTECNGSYRKILANGIKTLREETKTIVDELLGLKISLKNLTVQEYADFIHAKFYCDMVL